jgi:YidC/Oxa1 family membrane protein insertase
MLDNRNSVIAIVLSVLVFIGWQYFIAGPRYEAERQRQAEIARQNQAAQGIQLGNAAQPGTAAPATGTSAPVGAPTVPTTAAVLPRSEALAATPRVAIETPVLHGSISLTGGRIDDLVLKNYRETVDPTSAPIQLLEPHGAKDAYFVETGWLKDAGQPTDVPGPDTVWTKTAGDTLTAATPVTLSWTNPQGFVFTRTISVDDRYLFTVADQVAAPSGQVAKLVPYGAIRRFGTPHTSGYYVLHEGAIGVFGDDGLKELKYTDLAGKAPVEPKKVAGGWIGFTDKYWAAALIPDKGKVFQPIFASTKAGNVDTYQAYVHGEAVSVGDGQVAANTMRVFAGAKEVVTINHYRDTLGVDRFEKLIDWGWFYFITQPMFWLIDYANKLFGNFGLAILSVTVLLKLLFFPLANRSYESMSKMKKVQPELKEIQERFKEDKQKQQQAMMELYKREKINPLSGCVPILLQIPVFFSLYKVLFITIEMRHAPFFGWIHDLAAPDPTSFINLFGLLPFAAPDFLHLGVWPLIMGVTMWVQMQMNPAPPDPTQKILFAWMPVIFTFMLGSFPAGLVIYWAWNNTLSVLQQGVIMRKNGVKIELWDNITGLFRKSKPAG